MRKLLIYSLAGASLLLSGCSAMRQAGDVIPKSLERTPIMYVPDVQQGNVIEQGMINRLELGMSKSQVSYIMGTPMLIDLFHLQRWDYIYSMKRGKKTREQQRVALFFVDDRLERIEGDFKPGEADPVNDTKEAAVIPVPDNEGPGRGIFSSALNMMGLKDE